MTEKKDATKTKKAVAKKPAVKKAASKAAASAPPSRAQKLSLSASSSTDVKKAKSSQSATAVVVKRRKKVITSAAGTTTTKRRVIQSAPAAKQAAELEKKGVASEEKKKKLKPRAPSAPKKGVMVLRALSDEDKKRRRNALEREKEREKEAAERARLEAEAQKSKKEEEKKQQEESQARATAQEIKEKESNKEPVRFTEAAQEPKKETEKRKPTPRAGTERRARNKLLVREVGIENEKQQSLAALYRRREKQKIKTSEPKEKVHIVREVTIPETIEVGELASRMAVRASDVIKFLFKQDIVKKASDVLDADTAQLVVEELGHKVKRVAEADVEEAIDDKKDKAADLKPRAPVVTVMGHVDHGKTSLLDALRSTSVAEREAGGITQHIGAYQTKLKDGRKITFIDTPGHAAFTAMRSRGAKTTDIVVLVVAADDSVMPQTIESINHAKAANTPLIVALNKMDLPEADENKIMQQLLQYEVVCEPMGGDVQVVPISAKTGKGLEALSEAIAVQADVMELQANPKRAAQGSVVEAGLNKGMGHVATVLVQRGTLNQGDIFVCGTEWGKIRRMMAFDGSTLKAAEPSCPVSITGLNGAVMAGDSFDCVESEAKAREIAEYRQRKTLTQRAPSAHKSMDELFADADASAKPELYFIVKADVQGSADAIRQAIESISNDDITIKVSHAGVGEVSASDVMLAETVGAKVLMFNVKANPEAQKAAKAAKIDFYTFNIIYALIDEVKAQATKMLSPERKETMLGTAEILQLFSVGKRNVAAGCRVLEGSLKKTAHIRIKREDALVHEGLIQSLRHFKENVNQVEEGKECGMVLDNPPKLQVGDSVECFDVEEVARVIE